VWGEQSEAIFSVLAVTENVLYEAGPPVFGMPETAFELHKMDFTFQ
jgi:hypothetical protein